MLSALGFLLLLVGLLYVWQRQETLIGQAPSIDPAAFAGLQGQVQSLQARIAQLEQRTAPDLKPLDARIGALENRPPPSAPTTPSQSEPMQSSPAQTPPAQSPSAQAAPDVTGAVATAVGPLQQRMEELAKTDQAGQAALSARVDAAVAKLGTADTQAQDAAHQLAAKVDALQQKLAEAEQRAVEQAAQSERALRAQAALTSLESGKSLGDIPNLPPAAAKFASARPPTEADLRVAFAPAAARAIDASRPVSGENSVGARVLQHMESLVTIRKGDKVVVGTTAAQTLGLAQEKLDGGDLAGAVAALDGLDPSAAQAMSGWRAQAQSLLDARAALNAMTVSTSR